MLLSHNRAHNAPVKVRYQSLIVRLQVLYFPHLFLALINELLKYVPIWIYSVILIISDSLGEVQYYQTFNKKFCTGEHLALTTGGAGNISRRPISSGSIIGISACCHRSTRWSKSRITGDGLSLSVVEN